LLRDWKNAVPTPRVYGGRRIYATIVGSIK